MKGKVWNSKLINAEVRKYEEGLDCDLSPFFEKNINFKAGNLSFEYTDAELKEFKRCMDSVEVFAKHCKTLTDDGLQNIKLRDYQAKNIKIMQANRNIVYLASRQIGKCTHYNTVIKVKDKDDNIFNTTIGEFYKRVKETANKDNPLDHIKSYLFSKSTKFNQWLLSILEFLEYFFIGKSEEKLINSYDCFGYKIWSNQNWQPASLVHRTKPFNIYEVKTNSFSIKCADDHILYKVDETGEFVEVFVKNLKIGDLLYTENGREAIESITIEDNTTMMYDVTIVNENPTFYTNGFLSHNTTISSIFIAWYLTFNVERNVMLVANKMKTTTELVSKVKTILEFLPFYLKPGVMGMGATSMKFDNGCRLESQATTKTAAIGFTIHLLYADEFAHIHPNFIVPFYRSIYPTLSSSKESRIVITSTANGKNLFYDIYQGAKEGRNTYVAIRTDWWEVPGRDEEWKNNEIANLGSEELFNQEYGNQFIAGNNLLLDGPSLRFMSRISKKYVHIPLENATIEEQIYKPFLGWHPQFNPNNISEKDKFFFTVDLGDGVGKDYSVINIFRIEPQSIASIRKMKFVKEEYDFLRFRQIGLFRCNTMSVDRVTKILEMLVFKVFNYMNCLVSVEVNFKSELLIDRISANRQYDPSIFLHTQHNANDKALKIGLKIKNDNKNVLCIDLKDAIADKRIILTNEDTVNEFSNFGIDIKSRYRAIAGHDDIAASCLQIPEFVKSSDFFYFVEEFLDDIPKTVRDAMHAKLDEGFDGFSDTTYKDFGEFM